MWAINRSLDELNKNIIKHNKYAINILIFSNF